MSINSIHITDQIFNQYQFIVILIFGSIKIICLNQSDQNIKKSLILPIKKIIYLLLERKKKIILVEIAFGLAVAVAVGI